MHSRGVASSSPCRVKAWAFGRLTMTDRQFIYESPHQKKEKEKSFTMIMSSGNSDPRSGLRYPPPSINIFLAMIVRPCLVLGAYFRSVELKSQCKQVLSLGYQYERPGCPVYRYPPYRQRPRYPKLGERRPFHREILTPPSLRSSRTKCMRTRLALSKSIQYKPTEVRKRDP